MKKLTKIQLINWHLFSSQTIDIQENTLISGENGAGKSTLLDALQYVLIGGKFGTKFNIAANENAKRSLESYIKGKIGAENKEFLRNQDIISHIALEFYSEQEKKNTILGCILELPYKGILKEKFYIFDHIKLEENIFIDNNKPKNIQQIRNFFRTKNYNFDFFDTKKNYQKAIEKFLNINIQKYIKILPKALSFKPLNLQNFVFEFLLEESPINIISLKNSVQQLKKIEKQIELEKIKLEKLKEIIECDKKIKLLKNQININNYIKQMIFIEKLKENLQKSQNQKQYLQNEIKELFLQKKQINLYLEQIDEKILKLKMSENPKNLNIFFYSLQKNIIEKQNIIQNLKNKITIFNQNLQKELTILEKFIQLKNEFSLIKNIEKISFFLKNKIDKNTLSLQKDITEISDFLSKERISINIEINNIEKNIVQLKKEIYQKKYNLEMINNILPNYNQNIIKLIALIKEQLSSEDKKEVPIYPFCELIEIKEEIWRNAIEGFLGKRKFNLIIDSRFFAKSLKIYEKFKLTEKIYDVGLVNVDKIPCIEENEKSLSSKIKTDNKYALKYARLLLANIICELNIENLPNHKTAITPSGMIYSNFTAKQLNPKTFKIPFIGINSKKIRKEILLEEIYDLKQKLWNQKELLQKKEELLSILNQNNLFSFSIQDYVLWKKQLDEHLSEFNKIKEKKEKIKNNPHLINLEQNLKEQQDEKVQKTKKMDNILFNIAEKTNHINILKTKIISIEEELLKIQKELQNNENKVNINLEAIQIQFNNYLVKFKNNYDIISSHVKESTIQIEKQKNKQKIKIMTLMNTYITNHNLVNISLETNNINFFLKEYHLINIKNLVNYEQEAKELSVKIEIIFKEEFVNKLKESLENAKQQIKKLNKILKNKPFGNDYYQIITKPSENLEYNRYYSIFKENNNNQTQNNLIIENINNYKNILLDELFKKIMSFNKEYEALTYEFLDYRNYLNYDIQIQDKNGNISFFSKVFREKSGGETQVPFYIIIAICFEQLLFENDLEKGCLVLFDEAFNNMDENRIEAMMSFFNELKIQFIIAVPPQRIINILPYVTTNLVIIKENHYATIENFTIDK
ncbi:mukB N-terminal family protein [Candidatus Phytoplasma oryzae]|uniref:MukB N-terminal family protein n=1 Tax=Candidatus Phytoplasma oryzae TaxID=203274 RepID=A0A139JR84_9MOLU|nr:SbcC/MukB-like Walker B domain-containing protein [Candidatus Phytoplasma oryzae]KXT29462.1 mukB N-terminal family protein [Candidatus Phytoplasma oryzae]RAM58041.1 hypothetical protein DH96_00615 [Candidatus Phytoplasma oryzae]